MKNNLLAVAVLFGMFLGATQSFAWDRGYSRAHWGQGRWVHDRHNGALGWWWVVGGMWYFYPHPVAVPQTTVIVQQPAPQPIIVSPPGQQIVVQAPAPVAPPPLPPVAVTQAPAQVTPVMYYCKATGTYYPETMTCPNGWSTVTSGAPPAP